jgi:hypothetical protein
MNDCHLIDWAMFIMVMGGIVFFITITAAVILQMRINSGKR